MYAMKGMYAMKDNEQLNIYVIFTVIFTVSL